MNFLIKFSYSSFYSHKLILLSHNLPSSLILPRPISSVFISCMVWRQQVLEVFPVVMAIESTNFTFKLHSMQKVWTPLFCRQNLPYGHPLHIFFPNPPSGIPYFFTPVTYGVNTKINSWRKVISSCFENYWTTLNSFLYKQHFYMPHWAEIWFEMVTVSCIKRV